MVQNFIRVDGKFKKQEEIPVEQMREISRTLAVRFAEGLGYIPVQQSAFPRRKCSHKQYAGRQAVK